MSSDLLFSVIPRNTQIPVKSEPSVGRIKKEERSKRINENDKEGREQKQQADRDALQESVQDDIQKPHEGRQSYMMKEEADDLKNEQQIKHLDIYI